MWKFVMFLCFMMIRFWKFQSFMIFDFMSFTAIESILPAAEEAVVGDRFVIWADNEESYVNNPVRVSVAPSKLTCTSTDSDVS